MVLGALAELLDRMLSGQTHALLNVVLDVLVLQNRINDAEFFKRIVEMRNFEKMFVLFH